MPERDHGEVEGEVVSKGEEDDEMRRRLLEANHQVGEVGETLW